SPVLEETVDVARESAAPAALPVLTTVGQVHRLKESEARRGYPVHLRAQVTYFNPVLSNLTVQDQTDGIYVAVGRNNVPPLWAGQIVEIDGISGPGDF